MMEMEITIPSGFDYLSFDPGDLPTSMEWQSEVVVVSDSLTAEQAADLEAAIAAHHAGALDRAKAAATDTVNREAEALVIEAGIIVGNDIMSSIYADNAFLVQAWIEEGRPAEPDADFYAAAVAEGAEFEPPLSAAEMLAIWETMWRDGMRNSATSLMVRSVRRRKLEAIKAAESEGEIEAALAIAWE